MEGPFLSLEQEERLAQAFRAGRQMHGGDAPDAEEIESAAVWFREVAKGAVLLSGILQGAVFFDMLNNAVLSFMDNPDYVSPVTPPLPEQIDELFKDRDWDA
ncbi:MAG: hypothetical protein JSS66_07590 [Armatimonadetes bacterium]|nr:hypothetical protein [Armatimonadota bacterium]